MFTRILRMHLSRWKDIVHVVCYFLIVMSSSIPVPQQGPLRLTAIKENDLGISESPKVIEIQLPVKIASKEDVVSWARYIMSMMASKINITLSTLKDSIKNPPGDKNLELSTKFETSPEFQKRIEPQQQSVIPYPPIDSYDIKQNFESPPLSFLPLPLKNVDVPLYVEDDSLIKYQYDGIGKNLTKKSYPVTTQLKPILTVPFEAYVTITKDQDSSTRINEMATETNVITVAPERLLNRFENNSEFVTSNKFGQIRVKLEDVNDDEESTNSQDEGQSNKEKKESKKKKKKKKNPNGTKRQTSALSELLKMLGLRKNDSKNVTEPFLSPQLPVFKILKGVDSEKIQNYQTEFVQGRGRRNRPTSQRQENDQDEDDDDDNGNDDDNDNDIDNDDNNNNNNNNDDDTSGGNDNSSNEDDDEDENKSSSEKETNDKKDDDDSSEEQGGSLDQFVDLLPLVVPILEDLSDPESDTDLGELIAAGIPIIQGLLEGDEDEGGLDIAGIVVPILQNILKGPNGQGSDVGAIVTPIIGLVLPIFGQIAGPLIGPLSSILSKPADQGGSSLSDLIRAAAAGFSTPDHPKGSSPFSNIITGVTAGLIREFASGKGGVDISTIVSGVVSGALAGTSAGLSGDKHQQSYGPPPSYGPPAYTIQNANPAPIRSPREPIYSPTNYGGYGPNVVPATSVDPSQLIGSSIKDIFSSGLQLVSSLLKAVSGVFGASSKEPPKYGPPAYRPPSTGTYSYAPYKPPPTNLQYQVASHNVQQIEKKNFLTQKQ